MSDTGKQRRSRIELGYYRKPDAMSRWRGRLTLLACLVAGAWVVAAPTWDGRPVGGFRLFQQDRMASKGPVARPHAMWETKCEACHKPFTPINDSRWSPALATAPKAAAAADAENCHAGPPHHASERKEDVPSSPSATATIAAATPRCWRWTTRSVRPVTRTWPTIARSRPSPKVTAEHVTQFDADTAHHPAFTPPPVGSGRIKFSHARHMAKGQTMVDHGAPFRFADLDESDRARYGWTPGRDRDAIQLHCETCHRLDGAEDGLSTVRIAGAPVMAPRASGP